MPVPLYLYRLGRTMECPHRVVFGSDVSLFPSCLVQLAIEL